jgi:hypothetical protein
VVINYSPRRHADTKNGGIVDNKNSPKKPDFPCKIGNPREKGKSS